MPDDRLATAILDLVADGFTVEYAPSAAGYFAGSVTVSRVVDGHRRLSHRLAVSPMIRQTMSPDGALAVDLEYARRKIDEELARAMD